MAGYVIIGNGVAAAGCIEGIRSIDKVTPITVISAETHPVYCRPLISYYLEGKTDTTRMNYRPEDFYEKNGCEVLYGQKAQRIDPNEKTVLLTDGTAIPYTAVCVAAGSSPFVPGFEGLDGVEKKFSFMTLDDALALEQALTPESRVLIVGAGLIGLKCAEGIAERVGSITVCDLAPRVLSSILDETCAGMMQAELEAHGISFLLGDTATRFKGNTAVMKSGKTLDFDILILAVGVRPNVSLVKDAGGSVNRGILANPRMQTSLPGIYAAGDCVEARDISSGQSRIMAILPNAYLQGHCAGVNMAGGAEHFDNAIPMNSIGFFSLHSMSAGSAFSPEDGGEVTEQRGEGTLKRLFCKDGYLTGFMLIGDTGRAGIYTSLIRDRVPLDSVDFELLKKVVTSAAFSAETRGKKFGGVV